MAVIAVVATVATVATIATKACMSAWPPSLVVTPIDDKIEGIEGADAATCSAETGAAIAGATGAGWGTWYLSLKDGILPGDPDPWVGGGVVGFCVVVTGGFCV